MAPGLGSAAAQSLLNGAIKQIGHVPADPDHAHGAPSRIENRSRSNNSTKLLSQRDDDALGAADVAEPVFVFVFNQLADEFGAVVL